MRDITLEATIYPRFTTRAFGTGIPTTLAGTPSLAVYEENNTTEITAGVSIAADYDSIVGLNMATIVATAANGYEAGKSYDLVIAAGTVDGVSVIGEIVDSFTVDFVKNAITTALTAIGLDHLISAAAVGADVADNSIIAKIVSASATADFDDFDNTTDSLPALSSALGNLSVGSAAISTQAASYVLTTGTQSAGGYDDTFTLNAVHHQHTDVGTALDLYYQFNVGGNGIGTDITVHGRINSANDTLDGIYAWNWGGAGWDRIGDFAGQGSTVDVERNYSLLTRHTGTGANLGQVRIRFYAAAGLTAAELFIDQLFTSYAIVAQSVGYANGAIWVDTNASNTNTEAYVDGVADNPVSTWAAALTLSTSLGIRIFHLAAGSDITLSANSDAFEIFGGGATVALGGQSIEGALFDSCTITGIGTATVTPPNFKSCAIGTATLPPSTQERCQYLSTMTLGSAGNYFINDGRSGVAGSSSPIIDYNSIGLNSSVNIRAFSGGLAGINLAATTVSSWEFTNGGTAQVTGTGGSVFMRGQVSNVVNNSLGSVVIDIAGVMNQTTNGVVRTGLAQGSGTGNNQIQFDAGASAVDGAYDPGQVAIISGAGAGQSRLILEYDGTTTTATVDRNWKVNPDSTSVFLISTNPGREHVNEGLAQGGTSNTITLNALASSVDDSYNGQKVFIRSGTGDDQSGLILAYNGTTKVATIDGTWGTVPNSTSGYVMLPISPVTLSSADQAALAALPTALQNADALLNRDMSAVADTNARSPLNALRLLRNKWSVAGVTMTVTKEDDATEAWSSTVGTDAAADPVVSSDPG